MNWLAVQLELYFAVPIMEAAIPSQAATTKFRHVLVPLELLPNSTLTSSFTAASSFNLGHLFKVQDSFMPSSFRCS